jgi:hypothetical protein
LKVRRGIVITNYELKPVPEKNSGIGGLAGGSNVF